MKNHSKPDVLVVGAGPVGLFAALSLARHRVNVRVIDEEWRGAGHSYALALHPKSLELLDHVGVATKVLERARLVDTVGLYDGPDRPAQISLAQLSTRFPFVAVLPQLELESLLASELAKHGVKIEWHHRLAQLSVSGDSVQAGIDILTPLDVGYAISHVETVVERSKTITPRWLLAADGHESLARTQLGIRFEHIKPADDFVVFEFDAAGKLPDEVAVVLDAATTNVLWPLPNGKYRWSFQLTDWHAAEDSRTKDRLFLQDSDGASRYLTRQYLELMIAQRAPWFSGQIGEIHWATAVRFEYRLAAAFGKGHVWLAGDAAHLTSPVGAQSMNVGLREAAALCRTFSSLSQNGASKQALAAYDRERRSEWQRLLGFAQLVEDNAPAWVKKRADRLIACVPASGEELNELIGQLGIAQPAPRHEEFRRTSP